MYPFIRTAITLFKARRQPPMGIGDTSSIRFRAMPWDCDIFLEVNNGRQLTLFEQGRWDLAVRTGLTRLLRNQGWGLVVAGSSVRYRRRIRPWDQIECRTQVAAVDERWFYMSQSFWVDGQPCSHALFRTAVTRKGGTVPCQEVLDALGVTQQIPTPDWVRAWDESDHQRPWPPQELL